MKKIPSGMRGLASGKIAGSVNSNPVNKSAVASPTTVDDLRAKMFKEISLFRSPPTAPAHLIPVMPTFWKSKSNPMGPVKSFTLARVHLVGQVVTEDLVHYSAPSYDPDGVTVWAKWCRELGYVSCVAGPKTQPLYAGPSKSPEELSESLDQHARRMRALTKVVSPIGGVR